MVGTVQKVVGTNSMLFKMFQTAYQSLWTASSQPSPDNVFLDALVDSQTLVGLLDRSKKHEVCSNHLVDRPGRSGHRFHALGRRSRSMSGAAAENTSGSRGRPETHSVASWIQSALDGILGVAN